MSDKVEYSRLLLKRSNVSSEIPTIPTGNTLNEMIDTDTFVGEFYLNAVDNRLWVRTDNGQYEIMMSGNTSGYSQTLGATLTLGNETDGYNIVVSNGDRIESISGTSYIEFDKAGSEILQLVSLGVNGFTSFGLNQDNDISISYDDGNGQVSQFGMDNGSTFWNYTDSVDKTTDINLDKEYITLNSINNDDGYEIQLQLDGQNAQMFEVVGDTGLNNFSRTTRQMGSITDYCGNSTNTDYSSVYQGDTQIYSLIVSGNSEVTKWKIKDNQISGSTTDGVETTLISLTPTTFDIHNLDNVGIRNTSVTSDKSSLVLENRRWLITNHSSNNIGTTERAGTTTTTNSSPGSFGIGGSIPTGSTGYLETRITGSNSTGSKGYFARIFGVYRRDNSGNYYQIGTNDKIEKSNFTGVTSTITYTTSNPPSVEVTGEVGETITWKIINKWGNDITNFI